ncbi:hypothetical protein J7M23_08910, partial [Candidatus Sumerlaeota bacterium]|nr:hypothetical protein [Candidatus Sumerlaeota bacterium]
MERENPVSNMRIEGKGEGVQHCSITHKLCHSGGSSLKWEYFLPPQPLNNYPQIELVVPDDVNLQRSADKLGVWMYFDIKGKKTGWTIQPTIAHPFPTVTELGNWNVGVTGIEGGKWIYHAWDIPEGVNLSAMSHIRFYYHAGDDWQDVAQPGNKITIYLDDITLVRKETSERKAEGDEPLSEVVLRNIPWSQFEPLAGNWVVEGDVFKQMDISPGGKNAQLRNVLFRDGVILTRVRIDKGYLAGIWVRDCEIYLNTKDKVLRLVRRGSWQVLSSKSMNLLNSKWYELKVVLNGKTIWIYLDDQLRVKFEDPQDKIKKDVISLRTWESMASFSNFRLGIPSSEIPTHKLSIAESLREYHKWVERIQSQKKKGLLVFTNPYVEDSLHMKQILRSPDLRPLVDKYLLIEVDVIKSPQLASYYRIS